MASDSKTPSNSIQYEGDQDSNDENVLKKHVSFFDQNKDGIIYPWETYQGFRAIGCGIFFSSFAAILINVGLSRKTRPPLFVLPHQRLFSSNPNVLASGGGVGETVSLSLSAASTSGVVRIERARRVHAASAQSGRRGPRGKAPSHQRTRCSSAGSCSDHFHQVNFFLLRRLLGVKTKGIEKQGKVSKLAKAEILMLNIGSMSTGPRVVAMKNDLAKLQLTSPVCTSKGKIIALSRQVEKHWRLIGWGQIQAGTTLEVPLAQFD